MSITPAAATDPPLHLFQSFCHFFPLGRRRCFKAEVTTRELKFPTGSRWARGLARTRTRKALSSPNWIQMAVFVQGHRQHRHWECGEGNDSEGRGCSCTALRSQRPGWRSAGCVVPVAPDTPVPLDTESGDTLGFNHGLNYVLSGSQKETGFSNITSYKYWEWGLLLLFIEQGPYNYIHLKERRYAVYARL